MTVIIWWPHYPVGIWCFIVNSWIILYGMMSNFWERGCRLYAVKFEIKGLMHFCQLIHHFWSSWWIEILWCCWWKWTSSWKRFICPGLFVLGDEKHSVFSFLDLYLPPLGECFFTGAFWLYISQHYSSVKSRVKTLGWKSNHCSGSFCFSLLHIMI